MLSIGRQLSRPRSILGMPNFGVAPRRADRASLPRQASAMEPLALTLAARFVCLSAANGVTGLKPTWGRVSRAGVFELAAMFDHVGPLARSAADAGAILSVIAGADTDDPTASHEPVPDYLAAQNGIYMDYASAWTKNSRSARPRR